MKILRLVLLLSAGVMLWNCNPQEDDIIPEGIEEKYTLPQGNHEFDDKIVEFYDSTGVFVLYRYESLDANWNITGLYPNTNYPCVTGGRGSGTWGADDIRELVGFVPVINLERDVAPESAAGGFDTQKVIVPGRGSLGGIHLRV